MGGELRRFLRLERLSLRANRIKAISGLEMCASLQELELYENQLTSLHGLEGLRSLTTLDASFNQICEIDGLASLHALTSLYLANNKIEKIGGLDGLASLRLLELGSNAIRLVENLASVPSLTVRESSLSHRPTALSTRSRLPSTPLMFTGAAPRSQQDRLFSLGPYPALLAARPRPGEQSPTVHRRSGDGIRTERNLCGPQCDRVVATVRRTSHEPRHPHYPTHCLNPCSLMLRNHHRV